MNCPSRTDEPLGHDGYNQNPPSLTADLTTRQDLNGIANAREQREHGSGPGDPEEEVRITERPGDQPPEKRAGVEVTPRSQVVDAGKESVMLQNTPDGGEQSDGAGGLHRRIARRGVEVLQKYVTFIGPGFMIAVAYIDPGNYATDVSAGASTKYSLLFIVLMSNLFAIFLQSLCIKLGTVTGLNLAENCRTHLPRWLTIILYLFSESAIIATDIAEVIGSAIALNLLLKVPLVAGCAISIVDVLIILIFYNPDGSMKRLRYFELFVMALVLGVVVCFCIQLSLIKDTSIGEVFRGYLPSSAIIKSNGLYLSCGILGATVMPHSIFLGSGVVQPRLRQYDISVGNYSIPSQDDTDALIKYRPSLSAIRACLKYSIFELALSLFTFALFVNSAILIVAGASLYDSDAADADLFGIYHLLQTMVGRGAGTLFALALLLSGSSAGIVCTIAGQMVSEGMLNWTIAPWARRLVTRLLSITPSIIIAAAVGKEGLNAALTASQVVLSVILPFVTAPLIYFTARGRYMTVVGSEGVLVGGEDGAREAEVTMRNHWAITGLAVAIWLVIAVMNVALLVLVGLGKA